MKEYGPDGNNGVRMMIRYGFKDNSGLGAQSYRIYRQEWVGTPAVPPVAVVEDGVVYMSWNGATGITSWVILVGDDENDLAEVGMVDSTGFETNFTLVGDGRKFVKAVAYRGGALLRDTDVVVVN